MSVIDSRRYGRPDMTHLSRAEFERIKNTPPSDREKMRKETELLMAEARKAIERRIAREQADADTSE